ncbi:MAG: sulfatase [bacterium]|nr:sulfatase [bacterium]
MKRRFPFPVRVLLPLLPILFALAGCWSAAQEPPRWIFLVTLDTTRADHIDYSLSNNTLTPNLARLAAEGQYFENAYALIPITLPSHSSMFYSLPPHRLKVYNNGQVRKIPHPTVTQLLKRKEYSTGAVVSLGVLKGEFGLNKGFDRYIENFKPSLWIKDAAEVNRDAFKMIGDAVEEGGERRFFSWIHYSDPHEPYFPPHGDDTGQFRIMLDNKEVFLSYCSANPTVNIQFPLEPGTHRLNFETEIPPQIERDYPGFKLRYVKYRDFKLEPVGQGSQVSYSVPGDWNSKEESGGTSHYAENMRSEVTLENTGTETVTMKLELIYILRTDRHTRKMFYKEEVRYMDQKLGELIGLLKEKNIYDQSVFIIMGDHGEAMGEYRQQFGHIHYLSPPVMAVPLIVAGKGVPRSGKRSEPVSTLNIAPTILDLAGLTKPKFMVGHSLLKPLPATKVLLETYSPEAYFDAFSIIDYPYQVAFYPGRRQGKFEFFNLRADTHGPAAQKQPGAEKARVRLVNSILKISRILTATKGKVGKASERHREILKSLGYL